MLAPLATTDDEAAQSATEHATLFSALMQGDNAAANAEAQREAYITCAYGNAGFSIAPQPMPSRPRQDRPAPDREASDAGGPE